MKLLGSSPRISVEPDRVAAACQRWIRRAERWIADAHCDGKRFLVRADEY